MNSHRVVFLVFVMALGSTNAFALPVMDQKDAAYVGATVYDGTAAAGRPDMVIVTRAGRIAAAKLAGEAYRAGVGLSLARTTNPAMAKTASAP
jgi:hypothetical protein